MVPKEVSFLLKDSSKRSQRSLGQGDLLSPFLFIIPMRVFTSWLKMLNNEWINSFEVAICWWHVDLLGCRGGATENFENYFGALWRCYWLHISWQKSQIFPINEVTKMEALVMFLGREVGSLPTSYLGMSLGAKSKYVGIWNNVPEKCEKKCSRGKFRYSSLGGRLTQIYSVIDSLSTYMMSFLPFLWELFKGWTS